MSHFEVIDVPTETVALVRRIVPVAELPAFFNDAFGRVTRAIAEAGAQIGGPPFGWYHGMPEDSVDVAAGFALDGVASFAPASDGIVVEQRPGGRAVVAMHVGSYESMAATYAELQAWMAARSLAPRQDMWEEYLSPPDGDPSTWQTRIVMPLA